MKASSDQEEEEEEEEDDFDEVPEKEGYEPYIPEHLRAEYGESHYTHASSPTDTCINSEVKLQKKTCCSPNLLRFTHTLSKHTQTGFKEAVFSSW